jgi:hypothetical protein
MLSEKNGEVCYPEAILSGTVRLLEVDPTGWSGLNPARAGRRLAKYVNNQFCVAGIQSAN